MTDAPEAADPSLWAEAMPPMSGLEGRRVFIVGGASGIGAAFVAAFARAGAEVGFLDIQPGDQTARAVEARTGRPVHHQRVDVRDTDALQAAIAAFAPLDVLVVNAARDDRHDLQDLTPDRYEELMAVNLRPHLFAARAGAAAMAGRPGSIILMGSNSSTLGLAGYPAYVAAKGAITALAKALARELGPAGIRVNALLPGWVLTRRQLRDWAEPEAIEECIRQQSLKRSMGLADIVGPALFLASPHAAMLTGQALIADGGRA